MFCKACIVLYRFSTSNHNPFTSRSVAHSVVLYRFSTSNHNYQATMMPSGYVVLYRFSTSNHNRPTCRSNYCQLYYIVSLHQTTTIYKRQYCRYKLYYIVSLHQTTTYNLFTPNGMLLYYIVSLHQTTTCLGKQSEWLSCIISFLYIKPQPR